MEVPLPFDSRKKILVVVAVPMTVKAFLMSYLRALGVLYDVTVVCSDDDPLLRTILPPGVSFKPMDIRRAIDPVRDLKALIALVKLIRSENYSMVHSVTPKAGLLAQIASRWCGIGIRVHMFTGQVWVTKTGIFRDLLKLLDCLIAACASHLLADSSSQRAFLIEERVVDAEKVRVLGSGSISGVDLNRFRPNRAVRQRVRASLGYSDDDVLALFVGRLNRDKGVFDLAMAFANISSKLPKLKLLFVGPDEEMLGLEIERAVKRNPHLRLLGGTPCPEEFMMASDFFCLPSYREGFGSVVIEAAACGLPAIASAIYGLTDAVEDGKSGLLHPPHDVTYIAALLERFTIDRGSREKMGAYARQRAMDNFSTEKVVAAQIDFVNGLLAAKIDENDVKGVRV